MTSLMPPRRRALAVSFALSLALVLLAFVATTRAHAATTGQSDVSAFDNSPITSRATIGVNLYNGNALLTEEDLSVDESTYFVAYTRFYNSQSTATSELGPRWTIDVGVTTRLEQQTSEVIVHSGSGYAYTFLRNSDGSFQPPAGSGASLTSLSGGGFEFADPDRDETLQFNASGQLTQVVDAEDRTFTTTYTSAAGKTVLSSYGNTSGRRINVSYNGDQRIREIDDPASAHRYYGYDASGRLNSYQSPQGNATYAYDASGRLTGATYSDGSSLALTADAQGRTTTVTVTRAGGSPQTTTYLYLTDRTIVTHPDGSQETFDFDADGNLGEDAGTQQAAEAYYISETGVTPQQAAHDLRLQDRSAPLDDLLQRQLGNQYLGLWVDETDHRLKIAVGPSASIATVQRAVDQYGIANDTDIVTRSYTWSAFNDAFDELNDDLSSLVDDDRVTTTLEADYGRVKIEIANDLTTAERNTVDQAAAAIAPFPTTIAELDPDELGATPDADECNADGNCDSPLRGAQHIETGVYGNDRRNNCTAGFITKSTSSNVRRVLTAGHCVKFTYGGDSANWYARDSNNERKLIGQEGPHTTLGSGGDYGTISISSNSPWNTGLKPLVAQFGGPNEEIPTPRNLRIKILSKPASTRGTRRTRAIVCTSGVPVATGQKAVTRCGQLRGISAPVYYTYEGQRYTMRRLIRFQVCKGNSARTIQAGHSGGPIYKGRRAYGIHSGSRGKRKDSGRCNVLIQDVATALRGAKVRLIR